MKFEGLYLSFLLQLTAKPSLPLLQKNGPRRLSCSVMNHSPIHQREFDIHLSLKVCMQNIAASSEALVWRMLYCNVPCSRMCRMIDTQCLQREQSRSLLQKKPYVFCRKSNHTDLFSKELKKVVHCLFTCGFLKCDFKWNTAYSHWKYIELKLKVGFHGFWCLWFST